MNKKQLRQAWEIRKAVCDALGIELSELKNEGDSVMRFTCDYSAAEIGFMLGKDPNNDKFDEIIKSIWLQTDGWVYINLQPVIRSKCQTCDGHGAIADESSNQDMDNGLFDRDLPCPNDDCDDGFVYAEEKSIVGSQVINCRIVDSIDFAVKI